MPDEIKRARILKAQERMAIILEENARDLRNPELVDPDEWQDEEDMIRATLNNIRCDYENGRPGLCIQKSPVH